MILFSMCLTCGVRITDQLQQGTPLQQQEVSREGGRQERLCICNMSEDKPQTQAFLENSGHQMDCYV